MTGDELALSRMVGRTVGDVRCVFGADLRIVSLELEFQDGPRVVVAAGIAHVADEHTDDGVEPMLFLAESTL